MKLYIEIIHIITIYNEYTIVKKKKMQKWKVLFIYLLYILSIDILSFLDDKTVFKNIKDIKK